MSTVYSKPFRISVSQSVVPSWWPSVGEWANAELLLPNLGKPFAVMEGSTLGNSPQVPYDKWCGGNWVRVNGFWYLYFYLDGGHSGRAWNGFIRCGPWNAPQASD